MAQVYVTDRSGQQEAIEIEPGTTLMQTITNAGIADLLALCGGVCSCATCHVYVEGEAAALLPPIGDDEDSLLDMSAHRRENSRLSFQIRLNSDLAGLRATIAPED